MKKSLIMIVILLFAVYAVYVFVGGIFNSEEVSVTDKEQKIRIGGSSSGERIISLLKEEFERQNPNFVLEILPGSATGDGVRGVSERLLDIGAAARLITEEERVKYTNVVEKTFVQDAMVLGVNESVDVLGLTSEQVRKIHSGAITNWSDVGGSAEPIIVLDREESESSKILLRREVLGQDLEVTGGAVLMHSSGAMNKAIESTPGSIGQTSFGVINLENLKIKSLAIDGVIPSVDTITSGAYKMVRNYGLVYRAGALEDSVRALIDFVSTPEAAGLLKEYSFVPVI